MNQFHRRSIELVLAGVAVFALVLGPSARMASATTLSGTVTETAVSGFSGTAFTVGDANSTTHAVYGVTSQERSDKPCFVSVKKENVNDMTIQTAPSKDLCGPNGPTSSEMYVDFGNSDDTGDHAFVKGIRVCMNSARTRVKGLQILPAEVSDHGTVVEMRDVNTDTGCSDVQVDTDGTEFRNCGNFVRLDPQYARLNCDEPTGWMSYVNCPKGKVATALVLHYESGSEPRSLTGIALKCRGVSP